jgi:hypothetical protein
LIDPPDGLVVPHAALAAVGAGLLHYGKRRFQKMLGWQMAKKKAAAASTVQQAKSDPPIRRRVSAAPAAPSSPAEEPDTRRIMREAAWRQMFGNTQAKNPFDR